MSNGDDMIYEGGPAWDACARDERGWPSAKARCQGCRFERELVDAHIAKHPEDADAEDFEELLTRVDWDAYFDPE